MEYRPFGHLVWNVSTLGFGAWAIGGDMWGPQEDLNSIRTLHRAIDLGVNFIDTAQGYGKGHSEEIIGEVLRERTEEIFVATKVPPVPGSTTWPVPQDAEVNRLYPAEYIIRCCEGSLRRLRRDYVDVYQFHTWAAAFNTCDEWFEATERLKKEGKIRAVGVSVPDQTPENVIGALAMRRVDAVQVIYNLFDQSPQNNLFPVCRRLGVGVIARVPFDESALTGKLTRNTVFSEDDVRRFYFRGNNLAAVVDRVEAIRQFKNRRHPDMPMAEYALRFCISHPAVSTVIPGMRTPEQVYQNARIGDGCVLEAEELEELSAYRWQKDFWFEEVAGETAGVAETQSSQS